MKSLGTTTPQKSLIDPVDEEALEPHKDAITVGRIIIACDIFSMLKITQKLKSTVQ